MKRWLLRWLIGGDDVYVAIRRYRPGGNIDVDVFNVHTDFDGANEDLAGRGGDVHTVTMVID